MLFGCFSVCQFIRFQYSTALSAGGRYILALCDVMSDNANAYTVSVKKHNQFLELHKIG